MKFIPVKCRQGGRKTLPDRDIEFLTGPVTGTQIGIHICDKPWPNPVWVTCALAFNISLYILKRSPHWAKFLEPLGVAMDSLEGPDPNVRLIDVMLDVYKFLIETTPAWLVIQAVDSTRRR